MTARAFDAVVVAGGRGSRLGGIPKPLLLRGGRTLLEGTLEALGQARRIAVVGPPDLAAAVSRHAAVAEAGQLVLLTREHPAYGGPAAAVAAGLRALSDARSGPDAPPLDEQPPLTLVLAADMVDPVPAVHELLAAVGTDEDRVAGAPVPGAWVPVDGSGYLQTLCAAFDTEKLGAAVDRAEAVGGGLGNGSMMRLLAMVQIVRLSLPGVRFDDIDTWDDAGRHGISLPESTERQSADAAAGGTRGAVSGTGTVGRGAPGGF